jgi:hypothetical protein
VRHVTASSTVELASLPTQAALISQGDNTCEQVNAHIRRQTDANVSWAASVGPDEVKQRLAELDREWDIERVVEVIAPGVTLAWLLMGTKVNRKLLAIAALVQGFVLLHGLQGWFPPLPILRRLGIRTSTEIDQERNAIKALRGDFRQVSNPAEALEAVRR